MGGSNVDFYLWLMTTIDILDLAAVVAVLGVGFLLVFRMARTVAPGWRYEFSKGGKVVMVLDKPGFYMVSPFLTAKRVRVSDRPSPK